MSMPYITAKSNFKNDFGLCSSHEKSSPEKFWSYRPIKKVIGFGWSGWFIGFISYSTEKQIIPPHQG